jgi:hypothetical protein
MDRTSLEDGNFLFKVGICDTLTHYDRSRCRVSLDSEALSEEGLLVVCPYVCVTLVPRLV